MGSRCKFCRVNLDISFCLQQHTYSLFLVSSHGAMAWSINQSVHFSPISPATLLQEGVGQATPTSVSLTETVSMLSTLLGSPEQTLAWRGWGMRGRGRQTFPEAGRGFPGPRSTEPCPDGQQFFSSIWRSGALGAQTPLPAFPREQPPNATWLRYTQLG